MEAIRARDIRYVVALSSPGAGLAGGTGGVVGLHEQEDRLKRLEGTNVLLLRAFAPALSTLPPLVLAGHQGIVVDAPADPHRSI